MSWASSDSGTTQLDTDAPRIGPPAKAAMIVTTTRKGFRVTVEDMHDPN